MSAVVSAVARHLQEVVVGYYLPDEKWYAPRDRSELLLLKRLSKLRSDLLVEEIHHSANGPLCGFRRMPAPTNDAGGEKLWQAMIDAALTEPEAAS